MEEEKSKKGLYISIIIFLLLCLIGSGIFIYKRIYVEKTEDTEEKETTPDFSNILKMIPVKTKDNEYVGYEVSDLTDRDINNAIIHYVVNNSELVSNDNEKYYLEKVSNIENNLLNFLGLTNYSIKYEEGNDDTSYKFEKVIENEIEYVKIKVDTPTDDFYTYELQDLNNTTYNKDNNEYIVNSLVIQTYGGGGPSLKIGKANIYLKANDNKYTLEKVEFDKYNETDPIE